MVYDVQSEGVEVPANVYPLATVVVPDSHVVVVAPVQGEPPCQELLPEQQLFASLYAVLAIAAHPKSAKQT